MKHLLLLCLTCLFVWNASAQTTQKIKELERENNILKNEQSNKNSGFNIDEETYLKDFLVKYPEVSTELKSLNDIAESKGDKSYWRLERAYLDKLKQKIEDNERYYNSQEFISNCLKENQILKEEIIREYLKGVESSKPIIKLMSGDGKASIMPPSKPKTLADAGIIAQQILDKFKEI